MKSEKKSRVAIIGAGAFGRNHVRIAASMPEVELAGVVDANPERAASAAAEFGCPAFSDYRDLAGKLDAAIIAVPTTLHEEIGCALLESGVDVLIEKPIAASLEGARRLVETAERHGKILQVGHLERFNPAVEALERAQTHPLFFEVHRLSLFTPRSLDVDVVLDLMIHDLEIILALTGRMPKEIRAAGIQILSPKVDIANVRLEFSGGCIANLTASRASTEKVRKLRLFQPHEYLSVDYSRQELMRIRVGENRQIQFEMMPVAKDEPLKREWVEFLDCVRERREPRVSGRTAMAALEVALNVLDKIEVHRQVVAESVAAASSGFAAPKDSA